MASRFFSETRRIPRILDRQATRFDVLIGKHGRDGLFRGSNQVLVVRRFGSGDLVQRLVELFQLGGSGHEVFLDHERCLDLLVAALTEEVEAVVDQGLVQVDTVVRQEEATVAGDFDTWALVESGTSMQGVTEGGATGRGDGLERI